MLTIKVTDDLELSQYDPEQLVTARLQRPFLLDDDEAEALHVQQQQDAEKHLLSLLTDEQQQRRRDYTAARARAEFNQYKKLVENSPDPADVQAEDTKFLHRNPLQEFGEKVLNRKHPLADFQPLRDSGFTDDQLRKIGADPAKAKRKPDKTQKNLRTIIDQLTDHHNILIAGVQVMDDQLTEQRITNVSLEDQLTELRTANTTLKDQLDLADTEAQNARTLAWWSTCIAVASLLMAGGSFIFQALTTL